MKHIVIPLLTFTFGLHLASAALPLTWTVETTRAQPATFEAYQGETLAFEAALQSRGKPLEAPSNYSFYWQTNGMGSTYWESPCTGGAGVPPAQTNVLFATWLPSMDVGARVYNCFIGAPSNIYHAAFQLRLRPSPGATPNVLPLPVPVIDFATVRVLNPPWSTSSGTDTNAVRDIAREEITAATNAIRKVDGAAKMLPKYLWQKDFADSYPDAAAEYYRSRGNGKTDGGCSAVRSGGFLYRNFDFPFDDRAEFVVRMSAGPNRFASVGVAQVGTNLTEAIVTSGKPSRCYKWLPGATVDGINECSVVAEINVVDGDPQTSGWNNDTGDLHPLAAVRWILDNATNAQSAAEYIAANIRFQQGWKQNFHYMIADECETWIVENGGAHKVGEPAVMTNFSLYPDYDDGMGWERFRLLALGANITNVWYTNAYRRETNPPWVSDLREVLAYTNEIFDAWAAHPKEYLRNQLNGGQPWWQSIHTSIYDITNRVLRVAVQEVDDWYTFAVPSGGAVKSVNGKTGEVVLDAADVGAMPDTFEETDPTATAKANAAIESSPIIANKADKSELSGFVPYTDAEFDLDMGGHGIYTGGILIDLKDGGTTVFISRDGVTVNMDGVIRNIAWPFPSEDFKQFAVQDWSSLSSMLDDAASTASRSAAGAKVMALIDQPVQQKIVDTVNTTKSRFYDAGLGVEWTFVPDNGEFMFIATTNVNREVIQ